MSSFNSRKSVRDWNLKCAKQPAEIFTPQYWKGLGDQGERLVEEVKELVDAVKARDRKELVDALCDIQVVLDGAIFLAQHDHDGAMQAVCENNDLKYFTSRHAAESAAMKIEEKKKESVHIAVAEFEGERYFTVHRDSDNKIMKPVGHPDVSLDAFLPGAGVLEIMVVSKPVCPICSGLIINMEKTLGLKFSILEPFTSDADNEFCVENNLIAGDIVYYNGTTLSKTNYGTQSFDIRKVERWLKSVGAM